MSLIYPKEDECRAKKDPSWRVKRFLQLHAYEGKKKYFWFVITFQKILIFLCATVYAYKILHDRRRLAVLLASFPIRILAIWKLIHLYLDEKRVNYLFDSVHTIFWDFHIAGPAAETKIRRRFFYTNCFVTFHCSASMFAVLLYVHYPLLEMPEGVKSLPYVTWTPFDSNPSPVHEIVYMVLLCNMFLSVLGNLFFDMLFVYCVQHLFVQFELLKELLKNISSGLMDESSDVDRFNSEYFQRQAMERLKVCANHHFKLLTYGQNLQDVCSVVLGLQLIMSFAIMVINGYVISSDHSDTGKTIMLFNFTGSCFIQLSVYALQASSLREQSLSILHSIIECKWYLFKTPIKRALIFIMMNAEQGIVFSAAGMANVDNPLLVDLLQKAFSAITLLQGLINEQEDES